MRSGRTYEVFVDGKPVGLVGSTIRTLAKRRSAGYVGRFGSAVELRLIREVPRHESEDDVSYLFHLRAVEALDIARKKTYAEDGGLNKISPLIQAIGHPMLEQEMWRIGGSVGGRKNVESGQLDSIRPAAKEGLIKWIKDHPEDHLSAVRKGGRKTVESGNLARIRTREVCSKGGRIGGRIQGRKNIENGHLARIVILGGRTATHNRWHVKRGIVNPACSLCVGTQ